jgi:hypothetical protein
MEQDDSEGDDFSIYSGPQGIEESTLHQVHPSTSLAPVARSSSSGVDNFLVQGIDIN